MVNANNNVDADVGMLAVYRDNNGDKMQQTYARIKTRGTEPRSEEPIRID
jgi:hypothetical protein